MTRRGRLEIIYDILTAIYKGKRRITHIMYATNTSIAPLHRYLDILIECEAVIYTAPYYDITIKGQDMMVLYSKLKDRLPH